MFRNILTATLLVCFSTSLFAENIKKGFEEETALSEWQFEGDAAISTVQKKSGEKSLFVPARSTAICKISTENKFGTVTMWVYDSCVNNKTTSLGKNWSGPYFGVFNADGEKFVFTPVWRETAKPDIYSMLWTAEKQWFSLIPSQIKRENAGWYKFSFHQQNKNQFKIKVNDVESSKVKTKVDSGSLERFNKGFVGVCLGGGDDLGEKNETIYFDDIEFDLQ